MRVVAALVSGYFNLYLIPFSDSLAFHQNGIVEYNLLFNDPSEYFTNIFRDTRGNDYSKFFGTSNSFWNDTKSNVIIKLLSVFDIFSGKNFFINCLFYNFLVFFGAVALFKVFIKIFKKSSFALIACIFLLPSALFFSSMLHRDGLTLLCLFLVIYHLFFLMNEKFSWKRLFLILLFLLFILLLRNFVFITLIPALLAWMIAHYKPKFAFISFVSVYIIIGIIFFSSRFISQKIDLPYFVSERQNAFIEIAKEGGSAIKIDSLKPNFISFLKNAPQALNHSLLRPYIWETKSILYLPFSLEILFFEILFLLFLFFQKKDNVWNPLCWFCLFFSLSMFLVIGYTVPIIGAFVRYRSIYFTLFLIPVACNIDWEKLTEKLNIKINKI